METVIYCVFFFCCSCFRKPANSNYEKKTCKYSHLRKESTWRLKGCSAPASVVKGRLCRAFGPISARRLCHADEA